MIEDWTNAETHAAHLRISHSRGENMFWKEIARGHWREAEEEAGDDLSFRSDLAMEELSLLLEQHYQEKIERLTTDSMVRVLAIEAWKRVDWMELADHLLNSLEVGYEVCPRYHNRKQQEKTDG